MYKDIKLKIEQPSDPAVQVLGIYLKELKSGSQRDAHIPIFIAVWFSKAKMEKQPKCPSVDG